MRWYCLDPYIVSPLFLSKFHPPRPERLPLIDASKKCEHPTRTMASTDKQLASIRTTMLTILDCHWSSCSRSRPTSLCRKKLERLGLDEHASNLNYLTSVLYVTPLLGLASLQCFQSCASQTSRYISLAHSTHSTTSRRCLWEPSSASS